MNNLEILQGDALEMLKTVDSQSVDCVMTSPPYWGLRDYGVDEQIGLEETPDEYIKKLMNIFNEVYRVLKKSGVMFINISDNYIGSGKGSSYKGNNQKERYVPHKEKQIKVGRTVKGLKRKSLAGIPYRFALAMLENKWILRNDIIWKKNNITPSSVKDRFTREHEYVFMFTKYPKYYFKQQLEKSKSKDKSKVRGSKGSGEQSGRRKNIENKRDYTVRNVRTVWEINNQPLKKNKHFATYPEKLVYKCLSAGCPENGKVLDMFLGSGTTLKVAKELGLNGIGIELNPEYIEIAKERIGI